MSVETVVAAKVLTVVATGSVTTVSSTSASELVGAVTSVSTVASKAISSSGATARSGSVVAGSAAMAMAAMVIEIVIEIVTGLDGTETVVGADDIVSVTVVASSMTTTGIFINDFVGVTVTVGVNVAVSNITVAVLILVKWCAVDMVFVMTNIASVFVAWDGFIDNSCIWDVVNNCV